MDKKIGSILCSEQALDHEAIAFPDQEILEKDVICALLPMGVHGNDQLSNNDRKLIL